MTRKRKNLSTPSLLLTPQCEEILTAALYPYHLLTAPQITMLLRPTVPLGNLTKIQARLKLLKEHKYVQAVSFPTATGPRPLAYCLGMRGRRLLQEQDKPVAVYFEPYQLRDFTYDWYSHTLELNNVLATAAGISHFDQRFSCSDLQHDLTFAKKPLEWIDEAGVLRTPKPDAIVKLHWQRDGQPDRHCLLWIELDRGHQSAVKFRAKLAAIWEFFRQSYHEQYFGARAMSVCFFTTAGQKRLETMRQLARAEFGPVNPKKAKNQLFKFASIPPLLDYADYWKQEGKRLPLPLVMFTTPFFQTAYGDPDEKVAIITPEAPLY